MVTVGGQRTLVLAEQTAAVDPRLGEWVGRLGFDELRRVESSVADRARAATSRIGDQTEATSTRSLSDITDARSLHH